jgi:hypothetical protein
MIGGGVALVAGVGKLTEARLNGTPVALCQGSLNSSISCREKSAHFGFRARRARAVS